MITLITVTQLALPPNNKYPEFSPDGRQGGSATEKIWKIVKEFINFVVVPQGILKVEGGPCIIYYTCEGSGAC